MTLILLAAVTFATVIANADNSQYGADATHEHVVIRGAQFFNG
jgi:hypothetical protein